jgi:multiple sugar transport system ATP-binding protein
VAAISMNGLRKSYGAVEVLHGIDIDVSDGEFLVLVGPSGCGKSTLLRMVAGLEDITGGTLHIGERVVNGVAPKDRDIAMVFQSYALYPHLTVAENMGFSLRLRGTSRDVINSKVADAARILDLEPYLDRKPRSLSGGQRQRVAMGRAIVREPGVFLFDEPLSNLDAKLRGSMRTEIKHLHRRLSITTLYVTHDQVEAMTMADRIVVMNHGHIEQIGTPLDLYDRPASVFVAGFIGTPAMNLIEGSLDDSRFVRHSGFDIPVSPPPGHRGDRVVLGVRPDDVHIVDDGPISGVVDVVEPLGNETSVTILVGEDILRLTLRDRRSIRPGETVRLSVSEERVHWFDARLGVRL